MISPHFDAIKLVWRPKPHTGRLVVGTLTDYSDRFEFRYDGGDLSEARSKGFQGYPGMEDLSRPYNGQAMAAFSSRLLSRERPDYERILGGWRATPDMDAFTILGLTFGRLPTDMYEFIPVIEPVSGTAYYSDLAGLENYSRSEDFRVLPMGSQLELRPNPKNEHDCHAVEVVHEGHQVAHVKRVHADAVCCAIQSGLSVACRLVRVRLNGVIQEVVVELEYV